MIRRFGPAVAWAIIILILTGLPGNYFPEVKTFWDWLSPDKAVHLVIFGVQSFLIIYALRQQYLPKKRRYVGMLLVILVTSLFGLLTEVLQSTVFVRRNGNIFDFLADSLGAFLGVLAYCLLKMRNTEKNYHGK